MLVVLVQHLRVRAFERVERTTKTQRAGVDLDDPLVPVV
jgi:hypothetical protein